MSAAVCGSLASAMGDTILAAMEVAGAARRLPAGDDGTELWVCGEADLATVDPANAPTHVTCPTCGHTRRIRRPSATGRRTGGTGRATGEINSDGSTKLGKNALRNMVEATAVQDFERWLQHGRGVLTRLAPLLTSRPAKLCVAAIGGIAAGAVTAGLVKANVPGGDDIVGGAVGGVTSVTAAWLAQHRISQQTSRSLNLAMFYQAAKA